MVLRERLGKLFDLGIIIVSIIFPYAYFVGFIVIESKEPSYWFRFAFYLLILSFLVISVKMKNVYVSLFLATIFLLTVFYLRDTIMQYFLIIEWQFFSSSFIALFIYEKKTPRYILEKLNIIKIYNYKVVKATRMTLFYIGLSSLFLRVGIVTILNVDAFPVSVMILFVLSSLLFYLYKTVEKITEIESLEYIASGIILFLIPYSLILADFINSYLFLYFEVLSSLNDPYISFVGETYISGQTLFIMSILFTLLTLTLVVYLFYTFFEEQIYFFESSISKAMELGEDKLRYITYERCSHRIRLYWNIALTTCFSAISMTVGYIIATL